MKKTLTFAILLTLIIGFSSCSKYDKLLKTADNETKYKLAMQYYGEKKYRRATKFFEPVLLYVRGTERDDSANFYFAKSQYLSGDPFTAEYYFDLFNKTFPRSQFAEESAFLYGACLYEQSHRPELDPTPTIRCINAFNEYMYSYPNGKTDRREKVKTVLDELNQRLVEKSYKAARLYYTIEDYRSAMISLKEHLKTYPDSKYREDALYTILKSSYLYASHSKYEKRRERYQNTIDEYLNLTSEYPVSKYKKEAQSMYDIAVKATRFDSKTTDISEQSSATPNGEKSAVASEQTDKEKQRELKKEEKKTQRELKRAERKNKGTLNGTSIETNTLK